MSHIEDPAAQAVIDHHAQLAAGLDERVEALVHLVESRSPVEAEAARAEVLSFVQREILPHARAEERALYPPAAAVAHGSLLVAGMIDEHHALVDLVTELAGTTSPVRAAATARAISALFAVHLAKENDLVLPLLLDQPEVELAEVLAGMHELLGAGAGQGDGAGDDGGAEQSGGGCGCGGCGCGGGQPAEGADASLLGVDTRLDVREIPHSQRHAVVLSAVAELRPGEAVVLVAPRAPRPVLAEVESRFGAQIEAQWLQSGPEVWQVRLERVAAHA